MDVKIILELLKERGLGKCPIKPDDPYACSPDYTDIYDTDDTHIQETDEETMRIEQLSKEELKKYIQEQTERLVELVHPRR